ncbi:MAG: DNA alkylation repair protein [Eubacteriales bacterium]|nr:DNA alkylation repair protein [bacterium]MDY2792039.1 DNA alkylation repair protein [Eubacteriales bacterium]
MDEIVSRLRQRADEGYRAFHMRLVPNVEPARILGVRVPEVRALARSLAGTPEAETFLRELPHEYYEENNLHAFLLERERDYGALIEGLNRFLPFVDNWATCDSLSPALFKKHPDGLPEQALQWMQSDQTYTVRFGIGVLMRYYLDEGFRPEYAERVAAVRSEEYYVRMMVAWYFATALAAREEDVLPYLTGRRLDPWTHRKAIQKAIESNRITPERKQFLRTLR